MLRLLSPPRTGRVAEERVEPDVDGLPGVARDGDAPRDGRARDAEVAQALAHPAQHLVAPRGRLHKLWIALQQLLHGTGSLCLMYGACRGTPAAALLLIVGVAPCPAPLASHIRLHIAFFALSQHTCDA